MCKSPVPKEAMVAFEIITLSLLSSALGSKTNIALFEDLRHLYNMKYPMIICRNLQDEDLQEITSTTTQASIVSYDTNEDVGNVLNQVKVIQYWGDLDSILFVGSGHQHLIVSLVNKMKLFNFGVTGVIPKSEYYGLNLTLALNTRLFVLEEEKSYKKVKEVYAVKGVPITKTVGSWNETARLEIDQPNIWERRSDLHGATIRATSLNFSTLHHLNYDVSGGGGYFIEPLYYLAPKLNFTTSFLYSSDGKWGGRDYISNLTLTILM